MNFIFSKIKILTRIALFFSILFKDHDLIEKFVSLLKVFWQYKVKSSVSCFFKLKLRDHY